MTKEELIGSLQHEVHILVHLTGKINRLQLGYKPTENQRTTLELLQYLSMMGPPQLVPAIKESKFDTGAWGKAEKAAAALDFHSVVTSLAGQSEFYSKELGFWTDDDYRTEIEAWSEGIPRSASSEANTRWSRSLSYATILLPQILWTHGPEYVESMGRSGRVSINIREAKNFSCSVKNALRSRRTGSRLSSPVTSPEVS